MKDIIEQLNNLQVGDLVWWSDHDGVVIGIVTQLREDLDGGYTWRADFPQDGEHCFWDEHLKDYAESGMLGVVCKSET
tara:strand:+ start:472 stop:705 length:234 start_codon:yes stop_codon:yes gene_type:complete